MIGRISGTLISKNPPLIMVDVNGIGYEIEAPMSVFYNLPAVGEKVAIVTHLQIKDDAHTLIGFATESERVLFRQLLKISGIGAKIALNILSGISVEELSVLVADNDAIALTRLPGIGKKTAERLIIELRDKLSAIPSSTSTTPDATSSSQNPQAEASQALISLGYKPADVSVMVRRVSQPDMSVEDIIRLALQARLNRS
ncbi:MAG: Holliday junction branch migration protein RuvA [Xanthomonadales bacterium]|nr:Holliday junction branch migration protein RuvA [Xanthomonadales bacterium]